MQRTPVIIAGLVVVAAAALTVWAVASDDEAPTGAADTTTTSSPTPIPAPAAPRTNEEIFEILGNIIQVPSVGTVNGIAEDMGATGDPGWVPYLIDLFRMYGVADTVPVIADSLAAITGVPVPEETELIYATYGRWLHTDEPLPYDPVGTGEEYIAWKSIVYSQADIAFTALLSQVEDPILASQIQWGGVRRGGIPELNDPATVTIEEAGWMVDDELTFGAVINDEVRSYPHRILDHHEMANDTLGGEPVVLANCTLCRTGVLFSRRLGDRVLTFQSSGLLWNSNKVMVDNETDTLWNQITGEAIAGELKGAVLDRFPITVTTYGKWIAEHPDSEVLDIPGREAADRGGNQIIGGPGYSYEPGDAYAGYYASPYVFWPADPVPDVFADKDLVGTLDLDGERLAVGVDALGASGPQAFTVAGRQVVAVPTDGGVRFYGTRQAGILPLVVDDAGEEKLLLADGTELDRLQSGHSFWFAWYANYPDTGWWPA